MKIAVNCWVLRNKQLDGIGNFTVETLSRLIPANPGIHFDILCDRQFNEGYFDFPNVTKHFVFPSYRHPFLYLIYMEIWLPLILKRLAPDLLLSMDGFLSLRSTCRQLPVIYDLNFEHFPADHKWKNRVYFRYFFKRFAKKATRIATISEYSKLDIHNLYGIDMDKIDNVSCGVKEKFYPINNDKIKSVRVNKTGGEPYFFFIGSMHPRKNIIRLMKAFDTFKKSSGSSFKLMLSGSILWDDDTIKQSFSKLVYKDDIVFTGRVSDAELNDFLGASICLSFVPIFEGFGLPIVEAFQSEVPVICSNTSSMPEVAGDAALLIDPYNIDEIANAMCKIAEDSYLRNHLIEKGKYQKQLFSWEKTANLLMDCIKKSMD